MYSRCWILGLVCGVYSLGCGSDHTRFVLLDADGQIVEESPVEPEEASEPSEPIEGSVAPLEPAAPVSRYIEIGGADFTPGALPPATPASALPKLVKLTAPTGVTNGGSALLHATLEPAVQNQLFAVGVSGDSGYHVVQGADADGDGSQEIEVQVRADVQESPLVISVAPTDGQGTLGEAAEVSLVLVPSGVGDVKITLSFASQHDLDLHVIEPDATEISYLRRHSASGGSLDLDSGANCTPSVAGAENIYWPPGAAPPGTYRVIVEDFEQCERGSADFSVRVENGPLVDTYHGTFSERAEGTQLELVTFTH